MSPPGEAAVRLAEVEDSFDIARVHVTAWRETYKGVVPDTLLAALSLRQRQSLWLRILNEPRGPSAVEVHVVATRSGIGGFTSSGPQRDDRLRDRGYDGEISALYLLRSAQGRGFGRKLFEIAARALRARNHDCFSLWVLKDNLQAREFYGHLGGILVAERQEVRAECVLQEVAYGWENA